MKKNTIKCLYLLLFLPFFTILAEQKDYTKNNEVVAFIKLLEKEDNFDAAYLHKLFATVEVQNRALQFYLHPKKPDFEAKRVHGSWDTYEAKLLTKEHIKLGVEFMQRNRKTLNQAYKEYKVSPEIITAIIGIESFYGKNTGKYSVFDALVTLAFEENRRNSFFKEELRALLNLARKNEQDPKTLYGSFAGAMGLSQFMPSNYPKLGVDFDKDGKINLHKEVDAIGSIANYFKQSGWNATIPTATRVSYKGTRFTKLNTGFKYKYSRSALKGIEPKSESFFYNKKVHLIKLDRKNYDELWYGTKNFYVITRYNRSNYYAMAVYQLSTMIRKEYNKARKSKST